MKIFGICLVKNEEDIIAYSLEKHSEWADKIFVYDNGSTDKTWEIVQEEAKKNHKIVPFKSEAKPFRDGLRAEVFNAYRHLAQEGDWWCVRCDTDEFYFDNPRDFLNSVSSLYQVVLSLHYEYMLCKEDLRDFDFDKMSTEQQIERLNYYHQKVTSETRSIRHRERLKWYELEGFPRHKGVSSPSRIKLRHYQYRSPSQIQRRIEIRRQARESGHKYFGKDMKSDWKELIPGRSECIYNDNSWRYGYIKDPNTESWFRRQIRLFLHLVRIFP